MIIPSTPAHVSPDLPPSSAEAGSTQGAGVNPSHEYALEIIRLGGIIDRLLDHCPNAECSTCAEIICPHGERLHFHHDGCPACAHADELAEMAKDAQQVESAK